MASVRLSKDLRQTIINNALDLFNPALAKAVPAKDYLDRLTQEIIDKEVNSLPVMIKAPISEWPKKWTTKIKQISVNVKRKDIQPDHIYNFHFENLHKQHRIPKCCSIISNYSDFRIDIGDYQPSDALFNELETVKAKERKILKEQEDFANQIKQIVNQCNTLKQFLEAWPQGENLVPDDVMRTYNKPAQKRVNPGEFVAPEISTELSATLIKKRIANQADK